MTTTTNSRALWQAGGCLGWKLSRSFFVCVCVCLSLRLYLPHCVGAGGTCLVSRRRRTRAKRAGWLGEIGHQTNGVLRVFGWVGTEGFGGPGALRFLVLSALLFLFTVSVFFVFLIQELVMPFSLSLSLSRRQHPHTAATPPTQIHPQREEDAGERWMGTYLAQGRSGQDRSGQVRSGQDERGWNIRYLVVSCWRRFGTACLHAKGAIDR